MSTVPCLTRFILSMLLCSCQSQRSDRGKGPRQHLHNGVQGGRGHHNGRTLGREGVCGDARAEQAPLPGQRLVLRRALHSNTAWQLSK